MKRFDVWHQYPPVVVVERALTPDGRPIEFFAPAIFHRGSVEAEDAADAIDEAKRLRLTPAPLVRLGVN